MMEITRKINENPSVNTVNFLYRKSIGFIDGFFSIFLVITVIPESCIVIATMVNYIDTHTYIYVYIYIYLYIYIYIYTYIYIYIYVYKYICIYIYKDMHIRVYIYTDTFIE
jgi:hypothetical protein